MKIEDRGSRGRKKVRETDGQWNSSDSAQCSSGAKGGWCQWVVPVGTAGGEAKVTKGWFGGQDCQQKVPRWCGF